MPPNSPSSLLTYTKTPVQSGPTPEVGITDGIMVILPVTLVETVKTLYQVMTRVQPKLVQKGDPIDIIPDENGWELSIKKML